MFVVFLFTFVFFFSSRRRHTRWTGDWSSDVCSSDLHRADAPRTGDRATHRGVHSSRRPARRGGGGGRTGPPHQGRVAERPDAVRHRDRRARQPGRAAGARDRSRAPRSDAGGTPDRGHGARPQVVAGGAYRHRSAWRRWGYFLLPGDAFSYLLHLRPAEWPIMAAHTALGYLLAVGLEGAGSGERLPA